MSGNGRSAAQAAANESAFRTANERIEAKTRELALNEQWTPYLCECEDERCTTIVSLTMSEYEGVRGKPRQFVVAPGHQSPGNRIVSEQEGHTIVEKTGEEGRLVEEQDPRL